MTDKMHGLIFDKLSTPLKGHNSCVMCSEQLRNNLLATGSLDKTIRIWCLQKMTCLSILTGHSDCVTGLSSLKDDLLVSSSDDHSLRLWDIQSTVALKKFSEHSDSVSCVISVKRNEENHFITIGKEAFSIFNIFISGSWDKTIKIWSTKSYKSIYTFYGHLTPVTCLCITKQLSMCENKTYYLISGGNSKEIIIWNLEKLCLITKFTEHEHNLTITSIKIFEDSRIAISSLDKTISVWDSKFSKIQEIKSSAGFVNSMTLKRNLIIFSTAYNFIEIWDSDQMKQKINIPLTSKTIFGVFTIQDNKIAVNVGNEVVIICVDNYKLLLLYLLDVFSGYNKYIIREIFETICPVNLPKFPNKNKLYVNNYIY